MYLSGLHQVTALFLSYSGARGLNLLTADKVYICLSDKGYAGLGQKEGVKYGFSISRYFNRRSATAIG